jgi:YD repeat-containing protein
METLAPWVVGLVAALSLFMPRFARADGPTDPPDKGGTRPEAISLPSGPGSLQGLGESVSVVPATGAAKLVVPVALPPGPAAVVPDLSLRYDSRQGDGVLGVGWTIDVPQVAKRTDHGLPLYAPSDELLWNGQPLVEVSPGTWRLRVEGEFTRIVAVGQGYRADRRDGTKLYLGSGPASQVAQGPEVFRWMVDRVVDVHGDEADYTYIREGGQLYVASVSYGRPGAPAAQVRFGYETRPDVLQDARATFVVTTARRLAFIESWVEGVRVRSVALTYAPGPRLSRLASIQACGADGTTCLPPLTLTTTEVDPTAATLLSVTPPGISLEDPDTALIDVDGDSLPDIVQITGQGATFWHNLGPAGFAPGQPFTGAPGVDFSSSGVAFQDMEGFGRADLMMALGAGGQDGILFFTAQGFGLGPPIQGTIPNTLDPNDPSIRWLDLNGDGLVDALRGNPSLSNWTMWLNQGGGSFAEPVSVPTPAPWLDLSDPQLRLADMNDDGLVDIVAVHSGDVQVLLSLGFGNFAAPVAMAGAPNVLGDDTRLALGDADGDGLPDLYYVRTGAVSIWLNEANGSFGPEIEVANAPDYVPTSTAVRFADLEGEGTRAVVYSGATSAGPFLWALDLDSSVRPNLLVAVDNGMGGKRTFNYQPTGDLMGQAAQAGMPWQSVIPFPMQVATDLTAYDGRSAPESVARSYRDPYYDGVDREFRGFGSSVETHPGDAHAGTLQILHRFHTGQGEDMSLAGQPIEEIDQDPAGAIYRQTDFEVVAETAALGLDGEPCDFPAQLSQRVTLVEGGADAPAVFEVRQRFDGHGNVVQRWDDGRINGPAPDPEASVTTLLYAEDEGPWILGLPAQQMRVDASGQTVSEEQRYYDGAAFTGLGLQELAIGDLSRRSQWVAGSTFVDVERDQRDAYGNVTASLDSEGRRREVDYDAIRDEFPTAERRFPSAGVVLQFGFEVDPTTGNPMRFVDLGGQVTVYGYDALGRMVSIQQPDDPAGDPGELREYHLDIYPPALVERRRPIEGGEFTLQSADLYDGLLRPIAHVTSAEGGQFAVSKSVDLDAHGETAIEREPFFTNALLDLAVPAGTGVTETFHDGLGRHLRELLPAGGSRRWAYGPAWVDYWDPVASAGEAWPLRRAFDTQQRTIEVDQDLAVGESVFLFQRNPLGKVAARTSAEGYLTAASYDGQGNLVDLVDPDSGETSWSYDGSGHALSRSDGRGEVLTWQYDGAARILQEADGSGVRALYQYDVAPPGDCNVSAMPGRLLAVDDRSGESCFGYDALGRISLENVRINGQQLSTTFGYDSADRLVQLGYPDGSSLAFQYGGRLLVTGIPGLLNAATYDAAGLPLQRGFANGLSVAVSRDVAGRTVGVAARVGPNSLLALAYQLLDSGAPSEMTDDQGTTNYQLDGQERLIGEVGPAGQRLQGYDDEGRLSGRWAVPSDPRLPGSAPTYGDGAGPHALTADVGGSYAFDLAGERTASRGLGLSYDAAGQLVAATGTGFQASYAYGFDGQRRSREVTYANGQSLEVLAFNPFVEVRDGALWRHVMLGSERIATLTGSLPPGTVVGVGCGTGGGSDVASAAWLWLAFGLERLMRKLARSQRRVNVDDESRTPEATCRATATNPESRSTCC